MPADYTQFKNSLDEAIKNAKKVSISGHISPDPDALCSAITVKKYIASRFPHVEVTVIFEESKPAAEPLFPELTEILWTQNLNLEISDSDLCIFVDGSPYNRFSRTPENLDFANKTTFCIDHHPNPPSKYDHTLINSLKSSCTQILAEMLFETADFKDKSLSEVILLGILADTGSFKFLTSKQSDTLILVSRIMEESGLDIQTLDHKLSVIPMDAFELFKELVVNTKYITLDNCKFPLAYSYLSNSSARNYSADILKLAKNHYLFSAHRIVTGYSWGFLITPSYERHHFPLSLRAIPNTVDMLKLSNYFGGGGHLLAAGTDIAKDPADYSVESIVEEVIEQLKQFDFSQAYT